LGIDYFSNPKKRLEELRDNSGCISTGLVAIDKKLYGGFNRGELSIFCGQPGSGKSLFLQNIALNWSLANLNVIYLSLELSERLCSMRIDAMTSGYATTEIMKNIDDVDVKVRGVRKGKNGTLRIKQLKNGCTMNDVKAYVKEYEVQNKFKVDAIVIDYMDLCMPYSVKIPANDHFTKDKYIAEEMRNLAIELNCLFLTASQLNRSSYDQVEFDPSSISGGISKINTADNVIGIFTTMTMRDNGRYQLQFLKTRSSSGVGSKIDLQFDKRSLRIFDLPDDSVGSVAIQTSSILGSLRKSSSTTPPASKDTIADETMKLHDMLKNIGDE
jgi:archaellum biogenesis ATPase FlaH